MQSKFEQDSAKSLKNNQEFLQAVDKASKRYATVKEQEEQVAKLAALPINNRDFMKNLFRYPNDTLKDLLTYHKLTESIDRLKHIESLCAPDSKVDTLRLSLEQSIHQVTFKAVQATISIVNRDLPGLLKLGKQEVISLLKPVAQMNEIKNVVLSQFAFIERNRIRDVIADLQINTKAGRMDLYFKAAFEVLIRFCTFDFDILNGRPV